MPAIDLSLLPNRSLHTWESFNSTWAGEIAGALNEILPPGFVALESQRFGRQLEIDIGTFHEDTKKGSSFPSTNGSPATLTLTYAPPLPSQTVVANYPDTFEIKLYAREDGTTLVAAIELISPSNKDRPSERQAFVAKCVSYLKDGISLLIVDLVTTRKQNLHHEIMQLLEESDLSQPVETALLYAVSYRPVHRVKEDTIEIWASALAVGQALSVMPLRLTGDLFVPVDLETTYMETCRRRRML